MTSWSSMTTVVAVDLRRMARDRFLLGMIAYIVFVSVVLRLALPWAADGTEARWGLDLRPYFPLMVSYLCAVLSSVMAGVVSGFLLLESREEGTLRAIRVSPLPLPVYLGVLGTCAYVLGVGLGIVEAAIVGHGLPPWSALVPIVASSGLAGVAVGFAIPTFSANKVEAFAFTKILSTLALVPVAAWFVPEPWQWLAGFVPSYWAAKAWWIAEAGAGVWWPHAIASVVVGAVWVLGIGARFARSAAR